MKTINSSQKPFFLSFLIILFFCNCQLYATQIKPKRSKQARKSAATVQPLDAETQAPRRIARTLNRNFSEVEIAISKDLSLADISALPKAPGSKLEIMKNSKSVRVQIPTRQVEALAGKGADIKTLRRFVLIEGSDNNEEAISLDTSPMASSYCENYNTNNVTIPNDSYPDDWAYSNIFIYCTPSGDIVTSIDVHYEIIHTRVSDLYVDFTDQGQTAAHILWYFEGGSSQNISETVTGISTFNGKPVDQTWILWAADNAHPYGGYIDYWWIKVYYGPGKPSIEGYKFNDTDGNGVWNQNEPGLQGWEIYFDLNDNGQHDPGEPNTMTGTNPNGFYKFSDLDAGTYIVAEVAQPGWTQTYPGGDGTYTIVVEEGMVYDGNDFGNRIGGDGIINFVDWTRFANAWQSTGEPPSANWDQSCDIAPQGGDGVVDIKDINAFIDRWLGFEFELW